MQGVQPISWISMSQLVPTICMNFLHGAGSLYFHSGVLVLMRGNGRYVTLVLVADNQYVNTDSYLMIWKEPDISNRSCCVVTVLSIILRHFRRVMHKNRRALRALPGVWSGETRVFWQLIMRSESSPKTNIFVAGIALLKVMLGVLTPR
jgi:hypothetical protein